MGCGYAPGWPWGSGGGGSTPVIAAADDYGSFYVTTALTNTANGTPAKLAGAGVTVLNTAFNFTHSSPNRLTYTGSPTKKFSIGADISSTHSAPNTTVEYFIAKNGVIIANSEINRKIGTGGDVGASGLSWIVELAENDYIEIFTDASNAGTTTASKLTIEIHSLSEGSGELNTLYPYSQIFVPARSMDIADGTREPTFSDKQIGSQQQTYGVFEFPDSTPEKEVQISFALHSSELDIADPQFIMYPIWYQETTTPAPANSIRWESYLWNFKVESQSLNVNLDVNAVSLIQDVPDQYDIMGGDTSDPDNGMKITTINGDGLIADGLNFFTWGLERQNGGTGDDWTGTALLLGVIIQFKNNFANVAQIPS